MRIRQRKLALGVWDIASIYLSYNATYLARMGRWEGVNNAVVIACGVWFVISYLSGKYSKKSNPEVSEFAKSISSTVFAAGGILTIFVLHSWLYQINDAATRFRGFMLPFLCLGIGLSIVGHLAISAGSKTDSVWCFICSDEEWRIIQAELEQEQDLKAHKFIRIEDCRSFRACVKSFLGDYLVVASSRALMNNDISEELLAYKIVGGNVCSLLRWSEDYLQRIPPELISIGWVVEGEGFNLRTSGKTWRFKRVCDIVGSLLLLVLCAPLVIVFGLIVWLEDKGPIFYKQTRSGLHGRNITIWKIRSMKVDAERNGIQWAKRKDTRITNTGKFIRSTRIDELPQLVSVLKGDLSLIGPRPERPEIEEELMKIIPNYSLRHLIRPGLSGWAQVCYPYGSSIYDSRSKLSYELYYLQHADVFLDILIAVKTVRLVLLREGATPPKERK